MTRSDNTWPWANMQLKTLKQDLGPDHQKSLDDTLELVDYMIQETRSLTLELSPPILYELGLVQAVEWLSEQIQEKHGLKTAFRDDGRPKPMDDDVSGLPVQGRPGTAAECGQARPGRLGPGSNAG